jgi:hypothetical protein
MDEFERELRAMFEAMAGEVLPSRELIDRTVRRQRADDQSILCRSDGLDRGADRVEGNGMTATGTPVNPQTSGPT